MPFAILAADGTAAAIDAANVDAVSLSNGSFMVKTDGTATFTKLAGGAYQIVVAGTQLGTTPAAVARSESDGSVFVYADELAEGFSFSIFIAGNVNLPVNIESDFTSYTLGTCC